MPGNETDCSACRSDLSLPVKGLADNDLLWTCEACGADYTSAEMKRALKKANRFWRRAKVVQMMCTTCGATGRFVDGPDA